LGSATATTGGCDLTTAVGRRNYAILLLLARLGLRAGEVIALQLEDIDWGNAQITIRSNKGQGWARLPLPVDVGKAMASYLKNDRPRCACRNVFIRLVAPYVRLSNSPVIAVITRKALAKAGVESRVLHLDRSEEAEPLHDRLRSDRHRARPIAGADAVALASKSATLMRLCSPRRCTLPGFSASSSARHESWKA
jgi:integrase